MAVSDFCWKNLESNSKKLLLNTKSAIFLFLVCTLQKLAIGMKTINLLKSKFTSLSVQIKNTLSMNYFCTHGFIDCVFRNLCIWRRKFSTDGSSRFLLEKLGIKLKKIVFKYKVCHFFDILCVLYRNLP